MPEPHLPQEAARGGPQHRRPRSSALLRTPKDMRALKPGLELKPHPALGDLG